MPERFYGLLPTIPDPRDYSFRAPRQYTGQFVDLSSGIVRIYDQEQLGGCVPNGWAAAIDYVMNKHNKDPYGPSRLFIYYQGRVRGKYPLNQDTGLAIRDGVNVIVYDGAPPEADWQYDISKFAEKPPDKAYTDALSHQALKYASVDPGQVDDAIASGYPVVDGFDVYSSFESQKVEQTGILPMPKSSEQLLGGHCTIYVSTIVDGADLSQYGSEVNGIPGVKYRKKLNSWSDTWGQNGYYWEPVEYAQKYGSDYWIISDMEDPYVVPPQPPEPQTPDLTFAHVLTPWVAKRHTGATKPIADAAKVWLDAKKL
jgi:hypothetical protein